MERSIGTSAWANDPVSPRVVLLACLDDRRATSFRRAARARGLALAGALDHRVLLDEPERLLAIPEGPAWVRVDALGGGAEVTRRLLRLGGGPARAPEHGELLAPAARHRGFLRYLQTLERLTESRGDWRWLTPPETLATLFDKDATASRLAAAGIPTTDAIAVAEPSSEGLFEAMRSAAAERAFVKLRWGSSASGLAVVSQRRGRRTVWTTMEWSGGRWFNSLRVQRLDREAEQRRCLDWLLAEGARTERAEPKVRLDRRHCDLRVVVVAGRGRLAVARCSTHPITNLHLGGQRADAGRLRALVGEERWAEALAACERAATELGAFMVGVDVLFRARDHAPRVIEVNAFGDLLPGLRVGGLDSYEWQVEALLSGGAPPLPDRTGSRRLVGSARSRRPEPKSERSPSRSR